MRVIFGGNSDIAKALMGTKITREMCDVSNYAEIVKVMLERNVSEVVNCAGVIQPARIKCSNIEVWENEIK